jgi:4-hydroxymandelate oxidase
VWDYIEGGAGDELTVAWNSAAFDRVSIVPRTMVDVSACDLSCELFGARYATPLGVAPMAYHRIAHPEGEVATARGAGAAGALCVVSIFASERLEDIAAARSGTEASGPLWFQLYWLRRREVMLDLAARAGAAGYGALVVTADTPRLGDRRRDRRNGWAVPAGVRAVNLDAAVMASAHRGRPGASALAGHADETFDPSVTWHDLEWLVARTPLPVLVKGILDPADGRLAVDHGAAGVIVSNHGGRQVDGAISALRALPAVVDAVAGRVPVLLDGGVRRGRDAFVALALGATAVLIGRPVLWALAAAGAHGVAHQLRMYRDELENLLALAGRPRASELDREAVAHG